MWQNGTSRRSPPDGRAKSLDWEVVALALLALAFSTMASEHGGARFDSVFLELASHQALVLQANFPGESEPPLKARLFGTSTDSNEITITFTLIKGEAMLDGTDLTESPGASGILRSEGGTNYWSWEGVFKCPTNTATIGIRINDDAPITARLGDVWVAAGGPNVATSSVMAASNAAAFAGSGGRLPTIVAIPDEAADNNAAPAPVLASTFAAVLAQKLQRPIAVYTISANQGNFIFWLSNAPWLPLYGWDAPHEVTIGTRGIIWWWGEWETEFGADASALELLSGAPGFGAKVKDLQQLDKTGLLKCWRHFTSMIGGADIVNCPQQLDLIVQLEGVDRQPAHVNNFGFAREEEQASPWEVMRAAQTEAVLELRTSAAMVSAVTNEDDSLPAKWFWDASSVSRLATNLAVTAWRRLRLPPAKQVKIGLGLPTADWSDSKSVTLSFEGLPARENLMPKDGSARIQYSTNANLDLWTGFFGKWTPKLTLSAGQQAIVAVRYGAGTAPRPLFSFRIKGEDKQVTVPAFQFFRPP